MGPVQGVRDRGSTGPAKNRQNLAPVHGDGHAPPPRAKPSRVPEPNITWPKLLKLRCGNKVRAGELIEAGEALERWGRIIQAVRDAVLALPGTLVQRGLVAREREADVEALVDHCLRHIATGRPEPWTPAAR